MLSLLLFDLFHDRACSYLDEWIGTFDSNGNVTVTDYYSGKKGPDGIASDKSQNCADNVLVGSNPSSNNFSKLIERSVYY